MIDGTESEGSAINEKSLEQIAIASASHPVRRFSFPKRVPEYMQPPRTVSVLHIPHRFTPYSVVHSASGICVTMLAIIIRLYARKHGSGQSVVSVWRESQYQQGVVTFDRFRQVSPS